ncbi:MAG: hypothetical protein ACFE0O_13155 [Opitutales bacterium]
MRPLFSALLASLAILAPFPATATETTPLPPDDAYVRPVGDHLMLGDQQVRFWGAIGSFPNYPNLKDSDTPAERQAKIDRAYADAEALAQRLHDLGFNLVRKFDRLGAEPYTRGDGSRRDVTDYFYEQLRQRGMKVWVAAIAKNGMLAFPEDVDIVDDPETAAAWKAAVEGSRGRIGYTQWFDQAMNVQGPASIWDPRLEAVLIRELRQNLGRINPHSGLAYADDPLFAIWEQTNEEWFFRRMLSGNWQQLPDFFQNSLIEKWHAYLKNKYGDQESLEKRWLGLLPGEDLEKGTILFAPMAGEMDPSLLNDANPLFARDTGTEQQYGRRDFNGHRASDVLQFMTELRNRHKIRVRDAMRTMGKSTRLGTNVFDTGIGYRIQDQYMHQLADASVHDAYINGDNLKPFDERYPWDSGLDEYPRINEGVPWLEHNRVAGQPFLGYETQIMQPAKYRSEFPVRIASLASIQDWSAICWHYWGPVRDITTNERPFDKPMDITTGGHPQGYHYTWDEVQASAMKLAAEVFKNNLVDRAPNPTQFIYGRKSLYDPDSMDYGESYGPKGRDMGYTTYQYGVRIFIDPEREDDEIIGPVIHLNNRALPNPVVPNDHIAYDWRRGSLVFDSPGTATFTGFLANYDNRYAFDNGVVLRDVTIRNPEGIAYPVTEDEQYLTFSLASADGKPLTETEHAYLSLVSTSFNTGFEFNWGTPKKNVQGTTPVLVARVGATVDLPQLQGAEYRFLDWHMNEIARGTVKGTSLTIPNDLPVFVVEFRRP